ncbi:MAG: ribokinase [Clostridiales bacterium]|nr:ribokinase [Clostridiales bacterium]
MKIYDSMIIGHISLDTNVDHEGVSVTIPGGAVLYSSASAHCLGHSVLAVTKLAGKDRERLRAFTVPREELRVVFCERSTDMYNRYFTADKERRECRCVSRGTPFTQDDIPSDECSIYHLASLLYGDFPEEMIVALSKKAPVAVDVQGFLRHAGDDGSIWFEDWKNKKEILPYITYLKTDAAEAEILTGTDDRAEAAKILHSWGASEILITHNTEALAYDGGEIYTCPLKPRNLSGRTGRGDTTFAAYINERLYNDIPSSLLTAAATVSLKMETPGAMNCSRDDIELYKKLYY